MGNKNLDRRITAKVRQDKKEIKEIIRIADNIKLRSIAEKIKHELFD